MKPITTESGLAAAAKRVRDARLIAADTEAAGYHRYHDRVCLLQLSTRDETFVVDTLALDHLDPLEQSFSDPAVEVVFHDADYDLRLLDRDFGVRVRGLFDTKIAAQFLGEPGIGLASLLERHLKIRLEKKYQRADWAQRPLPGPMLEYAAHDTRHLPALRDILRSELIRLDRLAWAEEEFQLQESAEWSASEVPAEQAYLRLKGTRDLAPRQLAALRELFGWRESTSRARDVAPFRVLSNEALTELARRLPNTIREAGAIPNVPRAIVARYGTELVAVIRRILALPESDLPRRPRSGGRPPPDPELEHSVERLKAVRDRVAQGLGMDRGFLLPRHQLETIARERPRSLAELGSVAGIRRWQVEAAGPAMLEVL